MSKTTPADAGRFPPSCSSASLPLPLLCITADCDVFCGIGGSQALFPLFPVVSVVAVDGEEQGWGWLSTALAARGSFPRPREPSAAAGAEEPCRLPA